MSLCELKTGCMACSPTCLEPKQAGAAGGPRACACGGAFTGRLLTLARVSHVCKSGPRKRFTPRTLLRPTAQGVQGLPLALVVTEPGPRAPREAASAHGGDEGSGQFPPCRVGPVQRPATTHVQPGPGPAPHHPHRHARGSYGGVSGSRGPQVPRHQEARGRVPCPAPGDPDTSRAAATDSLSRSGPVLSSAGFPGVACPPSPCCDQEGRLCAPGEGKAEATARATAHALAGRFPGETVPLPTRRPWSQVSP